MKKLKKTLTFLTFAVLMMSSSKVFASNIAEKLQGVKYTEEFEKYVSLSDEEKSKMIQPRIIEIPSRKVKYSNPIKALKNSSSTIESRFSLVQYIPENVVVKDQMNTNTCWAFSALSSLETNLALNNYYGNFTTKVYDFSERHAEYATSRTFANNVTNPNTTKREVGSGGNELFAIPYLTNGLGAINESEMPFENNEDKIDISKIQNKTVTSEVFDIISFASENTEEVRNMFKTHIKNYGSVSVAIHGASLYSDYYNITTGAIYCDDENECPVDHAVSIVGWDDNYDISNFNEKHRPTSNGAWIIKNSWGTEQKYTMDEFKKIIFESYEEECKNQGWNDYTQIPDDVVRSIAAQMGYTETDNVFTLKIGDNGFMYVSYEDVNIYSQTYGIEKAADKVEYENIYQYNYTGYSYAVTYPDNVTYIGNIFDKKTNGTEYLTQVSLYTIDECTCKVYVNPNGTSKDKSDLQLVQLKAGESETFSTSGYHTLEFLNPLKINSNSFAVVIEQSNSTGSSIITLESAMTGTEFEDVNIESGKCFFTDSNNFESNSWSDLSEISKSNSKIYSGDSTIKAFTVSKIVDHSLKNIEITTQPNKTSYFEGDDFDTTGMVVTANYNDNTSQVLTTYNITGATNLTVGQTSVTISYEGKSVEQPITVEANSVADLNIKTPPTKTEYNAGENFDSTGMVIEAIYKKGNTKEITDYTIEDGTNLKNEQTSVTISYEGKKVSQPITVISNALVRIEVKQAPNKTNYVVGQNFDPTGMIITAVYENGNTVDITDYEVVDGNNLKVEQNTVTIKFEDKTVTVEITVEDKVISNITITKLPNKTDYIQEQEELDLTGGTIEIEYNDGTKEELLMTNEQVKVEGFNNKQVGKVTLTVTYQNKTAKFDVNIVAREEEETAINSDFSGATCIVPIIKAYLFTDKTKQEYFIFNTQIDNVIKKDENQTFEYYYYLSDNQDEQDIQNWVKINEEQKNDSKLTFTIDTRNIKNYADIIDASKLYLYIKEVAKKGGDQKMYVSDSIEVSQDAVKSIEIYIDGVLVTNDTNPDNNQDDQEDNTTASGMIPQTGIKATIIIAITFITVTGVVLYIKYAKFNKEIK